MLSGCPSLNSEYQTPYVMKKFSILLILIVLVIASYVVLSGGASRGRVAGGFPWELVLEENVLSDKSYVVEQETPEPWKAIVSFSSDASHVDSVRAYQAFFEENGWTISRYGNYYEVPTTFFSAEKDGAKVNVTLEKTDGTTNITIAYKRAD